MPSLDTYRVFADRIIRGGNAKKFESDRIMEDTWYEDIAAKHAFVYDYYHDDEPLKLRDLEPFKSGVKTPLEIKFIKSASQTYDKDAVTVHIQLKPSQKCNVDYYKECFEERYGTIWPIGLYIDIPDDVDHYNRWLIVDKADAMNVNQFPTYEVLPCDKIIQYIIDGVKYQVPAVLRSQNSYNSGLWTDYKIEAVEDQQKFAVPLNRDTEKIYYNLRMIVDAPVLTEPRAWHVSKVNRVSPNGIARVTLAQDNFDQHKDYVETDEAGNVIGMWADYYSSTVTPVDYDPHEEPSGIYSVVSFAGVAAQVKVGGSYKKFTVDFYDGDEKIEPLSGDWGFFIGDEDVSSIIPTSTIGLESNQIKIKAPADQDYIGKVLTVKYTSGNIESSVDVEIVAL